MKFNAIVGNPPYQQSDGGHGTSAGAVYNFFVNLAKEIAPDYISIIMPARWYAGGRGLDDFRKEMLNDRRISVLHDIADEKDCFDNVEIKGGVCYFLWDKSYNGMCNIYLHDKGKKTEKSTRYLVEKGNDVYIRYTQMVGVRNKVKAHGEPTFDTIVSSNKPYGLRNDFFADQKKYGLPPISESPVKGGYSILGLLDKKRVKRYIPPDYPLPKTDGLMDYKVFVPNSFGDGEFGETYPEIVCAGPGQLCTETFLQVGTWQTMEEAKRAIRYIKTKFFRAFVGLRKQTQHGSRDVYSYVPLQNFSDHGDINWNTFIADIDKQLYKKYGLTPEEINFIETTVKPMNDDLENA